MPVRLSTTVNKIPSFLSNHNNASLLMELYQFMKENGLSESHMNNTLKTNMAFAKFLEIQNISFPDVRTKDQITSFLDTKVKTPEEDSDKKWITTWNDYLGDIKYFYRWLHNWKLAQENSDVQDMQSQTEWETPAFARIKKKKTKRVSPYLEAELWDRD